MCQRYFKFNTLSQFRNTFFINMVKIFNMEGRRKVTDSLIGENPAVLKMFESLGFEIEAKMRKHTPSGKNLYQFAYHIDEKGVPELGKGVEFEIPLTHY